jgi:hypothetical protein
MVAISWPASRTSNDRSAHSGRVASLGHRSFRGPVEEAHAVRGAPRFYSAVLETFFDRTTIFNAHRNMRKHEAVAALTAPAHGVASTRSVCSSGQGLKVRRTDKSRKRSARVAKHFILSLRSHARGRACHGATGWAVDNPFRALRDQAHPPRLLDRELLPAANAATLSNAPMGHLQNGATDDAALSAARAAEFATVAALDPDTARKVISSNCGRTRAPTSRT